MEVEQMYHPLLLLSLIFTGQEFYAGENGIIVQDDGHRILLFLGGYSNQRVVHIYN